MREYELTVNMFLTHYLNVNLCSYSKKKWTHTKVKEIIRNRGLEEIVIEDSYEKHRLLKDNASICRGDVLLVRDQKGKIEPYYNPYHIKEISDCYMGLNNRDILLIKIETLRSEITKLVVKSHFSLESLREDFREYRQEIELLDKKKNQLKELIELYETANEIIKVPKQICKQKNKKKNKKERYYD